MIDRNWYDDYLHRYRQAIFNCDAYEKCMQLKKLTGKVKARGGKLIFAGNGASATIASHAAGDFTKQAKIPASTFHDPGLITMMANDYGFENFIAKCIDSYHKKNDVVILISSSGKSKNIVNAAIAAKSHDLPVVTFTGFEQDNELTKYADLSFWLPSRAYNIIENVHSIWLTTVIDMHVGNAEYSV